MTLLDRLQQEGPKRLLALDGGGIRGAISAGILQNIERELRQQHGNDSLTLSDYFDLIIGTSTGAIIAGGLAIGLDAETVSKLYLSLGERAFTKARLHRRLRASFDGEALRKELNKIFGETEFGSTTLKSGLAVVTKRVDTGSTWTILNHPEGKFYELNSSMLVRDVIRASAAAPTYFEPEVLDVGAGEQGAFVDGGVSMANNPALQAFLIATLQGFPFRWQTGADNLLLVSVGTGSWQDRKPIEEVTNNKLWNWATEVPGMLMDDASWQNQLLLQAVSKCPNPSPIDLEVGTAAGDLVGDNPLMTYVRYDVRLEAAALKSLGFYATEETANSLREMSDSENREQLLAIGSRAGEMGVKADHFPRSFTITQLDRP